MNAEPLYCVNHPKVETRLRCNKCGDPICVKCAVQTPVGYRCPDCIRSQQKVFYAEFRPVYYLIAAVVALPLGVIAGWLIPSLGWYAIILGPVVGAGIAEVVLWAIRRRRGPYTWLVVSAAIVIGVLVKVVLSLLPYFILGGGSDVPMSYYLSGWLGGLVWDAVYLFLAVGAAYARLRPGRRV